jgi:hypothetical protein
VVVLLPLFFTSLYSRQCLGSTCELKLEALRPEGANPRRDDERVYRSPLSLLVQVMQICVAPVIFVPVVDSSHYRSRGTTFRECRVSMSSKFPTYQTITQIVALDNFALPMLTPSPLLAFLPS